MTDKDRKVDWDSWHPNQRPILFENSNPSGYEYYSLSKYKHFIKTTGIRSGGPRQFIVFGVVARILPNRGKPTDRRIRIADENEKGVFVRIHTSQSGCDKIGPSIQVNDIIRIHSSCIQNERTERGYEMVVSAATHYRYTLFNYSSDVDAPIIPASSSVHINLLDKDKTRVKELREALTKDPEFLIEW